MAEGMPFIGSTISLISKSDIRYEGTLHSISMEESSIALQNVRSFGTEGRRQGTQVPPSNEVYEIIIFKGEDIKDLTVLSQGPPAQAPPVAQDPAIISASGPTQNYYPPVGPAGYPGAPPGNYPPPNPWGQAAPPSPAGQNYTALYGSSQWGPPPATAAPQPPSDYRPPGPPAATPNVAPTVSVAPAHARPPARQDGPAQPPAPAPKPTNYAQAAGARPPAPGGRGFQGAGGRAQAGRAVGRGNFQGAGGRGQVPQGPPGQPKPAGTPTLPVPKEDFDFERNLERFNKDEVAKEAAQKEAVKPEGPTYQKDDFFDQLSCEALERMNLGSGQSDWRTKLAEQKKIDIETFGGLGGIRHHGYGRGRGRGHGHGRGGPGGRGGRDNGYQGGRDNGYQGNRDNGYQGSRDNGYQGGRGGMGGRNSGRGGRG